MAVNVQRPSDTKVVNFERPQLVERADAWETMERTKQPMFLRQLVDHDTSDALVHLAPKKKDTTKAQRKGFVKG